ncbi:MAG: uncharacterized protein KVP18_003790 [Porospora cf. gigantea A]|uniref:uncharacterized protein n=3 Tax=Porospora cf. gigantea A TaxID=2853593 RepID=UPI00355A7F05|nr:MAG: hypothetical protein KVP18_003790 [Porospora cf. gigantea A]
MDSFRVLVVTDSHLGYRESDPQRRDDTFEMLDYMLRMGRRLECDLCVHAGDLYDQTKPSKATLYKSMELLKRNCLGDDDINFELVEGRETLRQKRPNFESLDVNVALPIFVIHGNHDDPSEEQDLQSAQLVNYLGKVESVEKVEVEPLVLRKGSTQLALYGLGNVRDERLNRALQSENVSFKDSPESFKLLLFHQNRCKGGVMAKSSIPETMLPSFMDLVIWGHEHDCQVEPRRTEHFNVIQPGASVVTSLSKGESGDKYFCIVEIVGSEFRSVPIRLPSRPFLFEDVCISETLPEDSWHDESAIHDFLVARVQALMEEAESLVASRNVHLREEKQQLRELFRISKDWEPPIVDACAPLIRLRVDTSTTDGQEECPTLASLRFGQQFVGKVANADDILLFVRRKKAAPKKATDLPTLSLQSVIDPEDTRNEMTNLIYSTLGDGKLSVLPEHFLNEAVQDFVYQEMTHSIGTTIETAVNRLRKEMLEEIQTTALDAESIRNRISALTERIRADAGVTTVVARGAVKEKPSTDVLCPDSSEEEVVPLPKVSAKSRMRSPKKKATPPARQLNADLDFLDGLDSQEQPRKKVMLRR